MNTTRWWAAIEPLIDDPKPDRYHRSYQRGDTLYGLEWLGRTFAPAPTLDNWAAWWATFDAWNWVSSGHHWDAYSVETLVLAHSPLVAAIAREFVRKRTGHADDIGDSLGADLFATGLVAVWETVKTLRFSPTCDSPESDDVLDQVRKYLGCRARNRMVDWLREFTPKWWLEVEPLDVGNYAAERRCAPTHSTEDVLAVIRSACQNDDEWEMIQLRWTGNYSQAEIAERLKLTRDDVQRSLTRILYEVEDELDLPHKGGGGRKRRRKP